MQDDYLAHHGVKGMRWGVRKERPRVGTRKIGQVAKGGMRVIGGAAGAVGRGIKSVPSRVKTANAEHRRQEGIEAIKRGDTETVKKNLKYLSSEDIRGTLDRMNAEKRLMSEISANKTKTGAAKVADALNGIGDSRVARAVKKGAAEGLQEVTKTVVQGVAKDSSDTAAKAVGAGIGSAFTAWAMYKTIGGSAPNYTEAFRTGATESLRKAAKDKYNLDLSAVTRSESESKSQNVSKGDAPVDNTRAEKDPYAKAQAAANVTHSPKMMDASSATVVKTKEERQARVQEIRDRQKLAAEVHKIAHEARTQAATPKSKEAAKDRINEVLASQKAAAVDAKEKAKQRAINKQKIADKTHAMFEDYRKK